MKTLIVEDDFTSRIVLQGLLSRFGECHIAVNGNEAVRACVSALNDNVPYDLICLDIMMPEMDGFVALKEIRAAEERRGIYSSSGMKIIMTTALDDMRSVMSSFYELCDGYLVKPIDGPALMRILQKLKLTVPVAR